MKTFLSVILLSVMPLALQAEPLLGMWQTEPDKKGQMAHVEFYTCDSNICAYIARSYDAEGKPVITPNVGKRVFWNGKLKGTDRYTGRAWVPAHNRSYNAKISLNGDQLRVRGCLGPICKGQDWVRVR